jgi:hypothetical protein
MRVVDRLSREFGEDHATELISADGADVRRPKSTESETNGDVQAAPAHEHAVDRRLIHVQAVVAQAHKVGRI